MSMMMKPEHEILDAVGQLVTYPPRVNFTSGQYPPDFNPPLNIALITRPDRGEARDCSTNTVVIIE